MEEEELRNVTEKTTNQSYHDILLDIITTINHQMPLPMEDMVLMSMVLNTKPKAD